jgi:hypothetical protein
MALGVIKIRGRGSRGFREVLDVVYKEEDGPGGWALSTGGRKVTVASDINKPRFKFAAHTLARDLRMTDTQSRPRPERYHATTRRITTRNRNCCLLIVSTKRQYLHILRTFKHCYGVGHGNRDHTVHDMHDTPNRPTGT